MSTAYVPAVSVFATLLAQESLRLNVDEQATTASFDPASRVVTLPKWALVSVDAWLALVAHEVGHAVFTPTTYQEHPTYRALSATYGERATHQLVNVIEDIRIERLMMDRYPGLRRMFAKGYDYLVQQGHFGPIADDGAVVWWNQCTPLDRINICAKVKSGIRAQLESDEERWVYARALCADTYDDVMVLVQSIADRWPMRPQEPRTPTPGGPTYVVDMHDWNMPVADRMTSMLTDTDESTDATLRIRYPIPCDVTHAARDWSLDDVLTAWTATPAARERLYDLARIYRRRAESVLASMVAGFRANQAAWQRQRTRRTTTGQLHPDRLAQYRTSDTIFRRKEQWPTAQSHGLVIHLDMSQSMLTTFAAVVWQTLHLIWFAEQVRIPILVYGFTTHGKPSGTLAGTGFVCLYDSTVASCDAMAHLLMLVALYHPDYQQNYQAVILGVPQVPRDPHRATDFTTVCADVYRDATISDRHTFTTPAVRLGGTPLCQSLITATAHIRAFRTAHRIEQCVSVWLTDGDDTYGIQTSFDPLQCQRIAAVRSIVNRPPAAELIDLMTGDTYQIAGRDSDQSLLAASVQLHRRRTGATVVMIDITDTPLKTLSRIMSPDQCHALAPLVASTADSRYVGQKSGGMVTQFIRQRSRVRTKRRRAVIVPTTTFGEHGMVAITRSLTSMAPDAYIMTHPRWWHQTPRELRTEGPYAAAFDVNMSMQRFAALLVPYIAAGRADATR